MDHLALQGLQGEKLVRGSREAKAETYEAIVTNAARLFRERGIDGTSVADVMDAAQKTHGGFYRHFASKDDLLATALVSAFNEMMTWIDTGFVGTAQQDRLGGFVQNYLSTDHIAHAGNGCPIAALATEVARGSPTVRETFGAGVQRMVEKLAAAFDGPLAERRRRATQSLVMAAGALIIARAADAETGEIVIAAARDCISSL